MNKICYESKENIMKGLEKLNKEPISNENAELYDSLSEALYHLELIEAMKKSSDEYEYSGAQNGNTYDMSNGVIHTPEVRYSGAGRIGMDGDNDGRYHESGRIMPRWYYSGHKGKDHMMSDIDAMMADADNEKMRRRIKEFKEDMKELLEK